MQGFMDVTTGTLEMGMAVQQSARLNQVFSALKGAHTPKMYVRKSVEMD